MEVDSLRRNCLKTKQNKIPIIPALAYSPGFQWVEAEEQKKVQGQPWKTGEHREPE